MPLAPSKWLLMWIKSIISISANRKWPEMVMVVWASTNQVWTKITMRSYAWSFGHSDPDSTRVWRYSFFSESIMCQISKKKRFQITILNTIHLKKVIWNIFWRFDKHIISTFWKKGTFLLQKTFFNNTVELCKCFCLSTYYVWIINTHRFIWL